MRISLLLALVFAGATLSAQELKTVQPADIANIKSVSDPRISPDGREVAYVVETPVDAPAPKNEHIWIVSTGGHSAPHPYVAGSDGTDTAPRWSPDGKWLAFLSTRKNPLAGTSAFVFKLANVEGRKDVIPAKDADKDDAKNEDAQLWLLPTTGGEAVPLTDLHGNIKNPEWSPDGRFIAFVSRDMDTPKEREDKKRKIDEVVVDDNYKFDRLWVYDLAKHEARLVTAADINIDDYGWSPDGSQFIARISPTPRIDDYWRVSKIVLLDGKTGTVTRTLEEHAGYAKPRWSSDGHHVTYSRMRPLHITDEHVLFDLTSGKTHLLESNTPGTVQQMVWTPDGRSVVAEVVEQTHTAAIKVDAATGAGTHIEGLKGIASYRGAIQFNSDGSKISFLANSFKSPEDVWLLADGKAVRLTDTNPQVASWKLGSEREISWKSKKDGKLIYGVVVYPPDYKPGTRYKTVVHIHGGPEEAWVNGWHGDWYDYAALLSSHGYVVLLPNPRGGDGQGPAFAEANYKDWGGGDFIDIQSGVDDLIAQGISDPDKLAIGGWSFGGFMTAWTVTHTDRYKAAMVGAGVTDIYSMATTTDISPSFQDGYFGTWATSREGYDAHSPVRYLAACHTPVLVLHGGADSRVPTSQGEEFYHGLRFLGRDVKMVIYPREPHIFTEREHQIDSLQRILDWYDSHLETK
ncbi:MAG TPA: S9 family peptidase [Terracidiphilus sp.]|nr:S9 family peptidase [Terracidiphilus sp.]